MNPDEYVLVVDTWEGQLDIDEPILKAAGIGGLIIRLNDMQGGHHLDENFYSQWDQGSMFVRVPYFVYNPWVSGNANYNFLAQYMPDCKRVEVDIEVKKADLAPSEYYNQVMSFLVQTERRWMIDIYTGEWFLGFLSHWPTDRTYWWARYPYTYYPDVRTQMTWETLKLKLQSLTWSPGVKCPGPCWLWQFTGDRLILPGNSRAIDISLWHGTLDELRTWAGQPVIPEQRWDYAVDAFLRQLGYQGPKP